MTNKIDKSNMINNTIPAVTAERGEPILMIMAAGLGSRYGGNKQIDPVTKEGDIIMDFSLYDAYAAGFRRAVFVIKEEFKDVFEKHIAGGAGRYFTTEYVYQDMADIPDGYHIPKERNKPWGTGHAVFTAREIIDAPFAVINADDYYGRDAFACIYSFLSEKSKPGEYCMAGFKIANTLSDNGTVSRGICTEKDGALISIEEHFEVGREESGELAGMITGIGFDGIKRVIEEDTTVSMNFWGFPQDFIYTVKNCFPDALDRILAEDPLKGEFYLPQCINDEIKSKSANVSVLKTDAEWFGVTHKKDKPVVVNKLAAMKEAGIYPQELWDMR